ncbi:hypothetical protein K469DRAFT_700656 [Zopfia rhizophila CBS 207.26]|uniref:Uncharacterized protein n=1 Tax=Zopfia rhizophila CBS 207.26 TaxID=1314779 RepID=A0A6A6EC77_9PEZI|nr:hypothetical protein K469DRAFT_700656 [Zopfia rhizophila CBS 207.26]
MADLAALLHDWGAEIDSRAVGNCTALQIAAIAGKLEVVRLSLEKGAGINLEGEIYGQALAAAHGQGHFDIVKLLIENGASEDDLRTRSPFALNSPAQQPNSSSIPQVATAISTDQDNPHFTVPLGVENHVSVHRIRNQSENRRDKLFPRIWLI